MRPIRIPKTPARAFDKKRIVSTLHKAQIAQLQLAILDSIETEGDAANYVRRLTEELHERHPHTAPVAHGSKRRKKPKRPRTTTRTKSSRSSKRTR